MRFTEAISPILHNFKTWVSNFSFRSRNYLLKFGPNLPPEINLGGRPSRGHAPPESTTSGALKSWSTFLCELVLSCL